MKLIFISTKAKIFSLGNDRFRLILPDGYSVEGPAERIKSLYNYLISPEHSVTSDWRVFENKTGKEVTP